jgi:hypothetical protein
MKPSGTLFTEGVYQIKEEEGKIFLEMSGFTHPDLEGWLLKCLLEYVNENINLNVNKDYYSGIIPCGITEKGIINFSDIKKLPSEKNLNNTIVTQFKKIFTD